MSRHTPASSPALPGAPRSPAAPGSPSSPPPHAPGTPENAALSRELADFLVELSIALHKHAIYPNGHPLLATAEQRVEIRLRTLLHERDSLSIGVARTQLVIEGVATDSNNQLLRELAHRLHRHHLGAVRFFKGIDVPELAHFLRTVATDVQRTEQPLGLGPSQALTQWRWVRLYPLTFGHLELLDEGAQSGGDSADGTGATPAASRDRAADGSKAPPRAQGALLWIGLARAALASDGESEDTPPGVNDPVLVAKAIDEHTREVAYDQVIVGYLLQIADELRTAEGAEATALRRRVSRMVSSLQPETLTRLLEFGGSPAARRRFVLDANAGMAASAVLELLKAAATATRQDMSHSMVRLLTKLAAHAEQGSATVRPRAEHELREGVQRLIADWSLDDPNPEQYREVLEGMARTAPAVSGDGDASCEPERVVAMAIEVDAVGETLWRAVDAILARGDVGPLFDLLDRAAAGCAAAAAIRRRVTDTDYLRAVLGQTPIDFGLLEKLVARAGDYAAEPMLDALVASADRATRRRLLDLLVRLGTPVGPLAMARLPGAPWYVQRNMLHLIGRLPAWPPSFSPAPYVTNLDARVRREAVRLLLKVPGKRDQAILGGLADPDEGVLLIALSAALERCPQGAGLLIRNRLADRTLDPELRSLGIRVIGGIKQRDTLDWLLGQVVVGKTMFGKARLAPKTPELLAALSALHVHWRADPRAVEALQVAAENTDPDIRAAVFTGRFK